MTFTGAGVNSATHSIGDGEYSLVLSGVPGLASNTYDFYRLLGDMDGNGTVDSADFSTLTGTLPAARTNDPALPGSPTTSTATGLAIGSADRLAVHWKLPANRCRRRCRI